MRAILRHTDVPPPQEIRLAALLSLAYVASLWICLHLSGRLGVPPFWPCNAFIAAAVVMLGRRTMAACLLFCALCSFPLFIQFSRGWDVGSLRVLFNLAEGVIAGGLARRVLGPRRLLRTAIGFVKLQVFAILPAALINWLLRESALELMASGTVMTWRSACLPHLLGMASVLTAVLLLLQPTPSELKRPRLETVAILLGVGLSTYLMFSIARVPAQILISPVLLLTAFRLGPRGAVFGTLVVGLVMLPFAINGTGTFGLHPQWSLQDRALVYEAVFLSTLFGVSLCAFMVAEQARLRRLLVRRAAAARDARRRALIASRSKTEFLATMSHEIRTPMNSILGFTQLLMHNPGIPKTAREQVKVIAEAGGSLMTVLNDILDFSKVESGLIDLHLEPLDVAALAAGAIDIMSEQARVQNLVLRLETEALDGHFRADGQRLRQVLLNLLNNAVKFTQEGHILLTVSLDGPRQRLRFEVRDTGIGIEEAVIDRLFTRFCQGDSSTTRHYGGSGLGLAICKGLVERMGGVIGVESRPGIGSHFWFEIPAEPVDGAALAEASGEGRPRRLTGRVLLVDDHPMNRRLGETLLDLLGCQVDLACSGEEAVEAAASGDYDAILMDVHMPRMDGLAATRAILSSGKPSARTPIIAMSADVMPQSIARCRQAGMVDHLAKPVQLQMLHDVLQRWMVEEKQKRRSAA
jgi:signal transduction histidine kinase/ActR/RegA family two-component response regulator